MKNTLCATVVIALALTSCAAPTIQPVAVDSPPPRPIPAALKDKPALTQTPLNERIENSLRKYEEALTKARR